MKIRNGFVSNSSTSSFCIFGKKFSKDEIKNILKKHGEDIGYSDNIKSDNIEDIPRIKDSCLEVYYGNPDWDDIYLGRNFADIGDGETGLEFKNFVRNALEKLVGEKVKCRIIEKAWYDG